MSVQTGLTLSHPVPCAKLHWCQRTTTEVRSNL